MSALGTEYFVEAKYRFCGADDRCAYCGLPGEAVDHVVPKSHVAEHRRAYVANWFPKVRSCAECNAALWTRLFANFSERKAFIHRRIKSKYRKQLKALTWTEEELDEFGYALRKKIEASRLIGQVAMRRLVFADFPVTEGVPERLFECRES